MTAFWRAGATGMGKMMADAAVKKGYIQGLTSLSQIGQGQQAQVSSSMADQAQASQATSQAAADAALMNAEGNAGAIGTAIGGAAKGFAGTQGGAISGFNGNAQTGYTNQQPYTVGPQP